MTDFARLGLSVDSSQVDKGKASLVDLTGAAGTAENASKRFNAAIDKLMGALGRIEAAVIGVERAIKSMGQGTGQANAAMKAFDAVTGVTTASLQAMDVVTAQVTMDMRGLGVSASAAAVGLKEEAAAARSVEVATEAATAATRAHNAVVATSGNLSKAAAFQQRNLAYQLLDVSQTLALGMNPLMVLMQQGPQIAQIYGPSEGGLGRAFQESGKMIGGFISRLAPLLIGVAALAGVFAGLTYEINKTAETQVSFGDVVSATMQLAAESITQFFSPAISWLGAALAGVWDFVWPIWKANLNAIIRSFSFAVQAIGALWNGLPAAIGDAVITSANVIVKGVEWSINKATELLNQFIMKANEGLAALPGGLSISTVQGVNFAGAANPYAGAIGKLGSDLGDASGAFNTDYVGNALGAIGDRAQQLASAKKAVEDLGGAASAANDNVKKLGDDGFKSVTSWAEQFGQAAKSAFNDLGSGIIDAFKKGGDIASNILGMLMDRVSQLGETLLNNGLNSIFSNLLGGLMGGGMWNIPSAFTPGGFFPGFANGTSSAPGGMAWVGEDGPELVNLPRGSQVLPNAQSMNMAANQNAAPSKMDVTVRVDVSGAKGDAQIAALARQAAMEGVGQAIKANNKQLPNLMADYNMRQG